MKKLLIALLSLATSLSLLAAEGFSSLEEQMTGKEYTAAGLDKLTQAELDALNAWIRRHSLATLDTPAASTGGAVAAETTGDQRGIKSKSKEEDRTEINSNLVGKFTGWDGKTIFKLENGMIWEQADKDKFFIKEVENPAVKIKPGMFGSWRLSIVGHSSECRVERIQ
jgi:hypothetical protein